MLIGATRGQPAERFLEKSRLTWAISEFVNLLLLADPTCPTNPKTLGQGLRKKRMDLGLQIKELAKIGSCHFRHNYELGVKECQTEWGEFENG